VYQWKVKTNDLIRYDISRSQSEYLYKSPQWNHQDIYLWYSNNQQLNCTRNIDLADLLVLI